MESIIENFNGLNCTGTDGSKNRVLTISNKVLTNNNNFLVFVNNQFMHNIQDYTVTHNDSSSTITFLNYLWNDQRITVIYSTERDYTLTGEESIIPLDTQYINNEISYFGDTVVIRNISKLDYDDRGNSQEVLGDSKVYYTDVPDTELDCYNTTWIAQTFTTEDAFSTTSIKLRLKRTGTPGTLTISIKEVDGSNNPTGSDLVSESLDYTELISDGSTEYISLPLDSYTLSANTTYAIVIRTNTGDSSNKYGIMSISSGTYSGGNSLTSSDSGSSWTAGSSDIYFNIYGDTTSAAIIDILKQDDESVKSGQFQSGDKRFFFQNSEVNLSRGTLLQHDSKWYKIDDIITDSLGDNTYFIEVLAKKI